MTHSRSTHGTGWKSHSTLTAMWYQEDNQFSIFIVTNLFGILVALFVFITLRLIFAKKKR